MTTLARKFVALLPMLLFIGCGGKKPAAKKEIAEPDAQIELAGAVQGRGWHIPWAARDPKNPTKSVPVLVADADEGALSGDAENPTARLRGVRVKIYQEGKPAANLTAWQVTANRKAGILNGSGGCRLVSLDRLRGTILTSDRMTWHAGEDKIEADGNAHITGRTEAGVKFSYSGAHILYRIANETFEAQ